MRLRRTHPENQGREARAPTTDARTAAQRRARELLSDAARTALRDADTVARRRARAELSPDRRNAIAAAAAEHDRARRPRLSEIAANATASAGSGGPLTLDAVAVSPAQLADRERDPVAALLALSQYSADFTCDALAGRVERARKGSPEHDAAIAAVSDYVKAQIPSPERKAELLRAWDERFDERRAHFACSACGMRSLASTAHTMAEMPLSDPCFAAFAYTPEAAAAFDGLDCLNDLIGNALVDVRAVFG